MRAGLQPLQGRVVHARSAGGEQAAQPYLDGNMAGRRGSMDGGGRRLGLLSRALHGTDARLQRFYFLLVGLLRVQHLLLELPQALLHCFGIIGQRSA
ncbi:MAG: hypothetical protein HY028_00735 [Gammaproteobacteria bacterium]|nr:hypothetical protein [Gammaproteobacteria bacterium]